jgi:hypothetical protein
LLRSPPTYAAKFVRGFAIRRTQRLYPAHKSRIYEYKSVSVARRTFAMIEASNVRSASVRSAGSSTEGRAGRDPGIGV